MLRDYRELVIEDLAASESALVARVCELEAAVFGYRELACAAMHYIAVLARERDGARRALRQVRESQPGRAA